MKANLKQSLGMAPHLSAVELQLLLSDDDASDAFRRAALHLEGCKTCQSNLTTFAGDPDLWHDAQTLLSAENQPRWQPELSQCSAVLPEGTDSREAVDDRVLKLLGVPKHPEMLGRLGRYDIEKIIGSGGMGIVLKAHDSELNRPIAIKILAPHLSHVGAARERFAREGRAAAAVVHEHVVAIYNVEADGTLPFLTMQYVPGHSLQHRVDENGPLSVEEILRIGLQAACGLAAAHAHGLVHRDVKPSNILLEDTVERAVLTDFGLARAMDDASLTQTGIIAGTPHYMSPEQASGGDIDARSDLFSLGAVLYFMSTGHPPFRAASALAVLHRICREPHRPVRYWNKDVPDELADTIDQLLEKKPSRRIASAEDVRQRLAQQLSHVQQFGLGRRSFSPWRYKRGRRKLLAGLSILLAAMVATAGALWFVQPGPNPSTSESLPTDLSTGGETEFFTGLGAVRETLNSASRETPYTRARDDSWRREIESLQRDLKKLESNNH
jgi:serine/threonine protein kinase